MVRTPALFRKVSLLILLSVLFVITCSKARANEEGNGQMQTSNHRVISGIKKMVEDDLVQSRFRIERKVIFKLVIDERRVENKRKGEVGETDLFDHDATGDEGIMRGSFAPSLSPMNNSEPGLHNSSFMLDPEKQTLIPSILSLFESRPPSPTPGQSNLPTQQSSNATLSTHFDSEDIINNTTMFHSQHPSLSPSIKQFQSNLPTFFNTNISQSSKEASSQIPLQEIELVPFTILISADNVGIDMDKIRNISETHMTDTFDKLLSEQDFESVSLIINQGDDFKVKLRKNRFIYDFHGKAYFRTEMVIDERKVHLARMRAFDTENMESFIDLLRDSGLNTSSVSILSLDKRSSDSNDADDEKEGIREEDSSSFSRKSGDGSQGSNIKERDDENSNVLVSIGSISFAIASIAFIIGVFILYKMVKRMRDHVNVETAVALDNSVISQTGVESKTLSDQCPFPTSHSIYRIEEEESHSQEEDDFC